MYRDGWKEEEREEQEEISSKHSARLARRTEPSSVERGGRTVHGGVEGPAGRGSARWYLEQVERACGDLVFRDRWLLSFQGGFNVCRRQRLSILLAGCRFGVLLSFRVFWILSVSSGVNSNLISE